VVQRSLFGFQPQAEWYWDEMTTPLDGPDLLGIDEPGQAVIEAPSTETLRLTHPETDERMDVKMVPRVSWHLGPRVELRTSHLWSAEAGGPDGATIARFDCGGNFEHSVDIWQGERRLASVSRDMEFRFHLTAWTEADASEREGEKRYGQAQVEDWSELRRTMSVVSPSPQGVNLSIDTAFGDSVELMIDGVPLGIYPTGTITVTNLLVGRHELHARSAGNPAVTVSTTTQFLIEKDRVGDPIDLVPGPGIDQEARYRFWFTTMAAFHTGGSGPLSHLEHLASIVGYPPLRNDVRNDPRGNLDGIDLWIKGFRYHLGYVGGRLDNRGVEDPRGTLELAQDMLSLTDLVIEMLLELPLELARAGRASVCLSSSGGRTAFVVRVQTAEGPKDLIEGIEEGGGCIVSPSSSLGVTLARVDDVMTAMTIVGMTLTLFFDAVELAEAIDEGDGDRIAWASFDLGVDMAQMVICALKVMTDLGVMVMRTVTRSVLTVVGAAIAVVATFMDAYREAGNDFWGAWDLLLHPGDFSAALRTAGFFSAVASLVTTAVVTAALPLLTGATIASSFALAVMAATGVGLIVFGAILAVWAIMNWDKVRGWFSGTAKSEDLDLVIRDIEKVLDSTMDIIARLNGVDVGAQLQDARTERGLGLALMHLGTTSGDPGIVASLGRADLHHLDGGSAQGRRAKAACELRHWITVLWREVDDLVDDDGPNRGDEHSEGFPDYKGSLGSKDHTFDADIKVATGGNRGRALTQSDGRLVDFLRNLDPSEAVNTTVSISVDGEVYGEAMEKWVRAIGAISAQIQEASMALARASRESAYVASFGAEASYSRDRGLVELRMPSNVVWAKVEVACPDGAVVVGGQVLEGPQIVEFNGTSTLLLVTRWTAWSKVVGLWAPDGADYENEVECQVAHWYELDFGTAVLDHTSD
jgi:hypothetical protein